MKVLIIGAKGMLGQELVKTFQQGNEVLAWDREEVDIVKIKNQKSKIKDWGIELIINAAAYNDVDRAETDFDNAYAVNGRAVGDLAQICRELDIPLVHYSTDYVFDGTKKDGYTEADQPGPISRYGASKYLGERELQKNTDKFYLIRLSRLFGGSTSPGLRPPSPGLGGGGERSKKSFVSLMLELVKTKSEIEVVDEELSGPTYDADLAKLTRDIIGKKLPYGIYHGANSGACTWFGFATEIFNIIKKNVKIIPVTSKRFPRPARRPQYSILRNTKLPVARPWQEALQEFLRYH